MQSLKPGCIPQEAVSKPVLDFFFDENSVLSFSSSRFQGILWFYEIALYFFRQGKEEGFDICLLVVEGQIVISELQGRCLGKLFCKPWVRAGPMMAWEILWEDFLWPKVLSNLLGFIWALLLTCTWKKLTPSLASSSQSAEITQTLVNGDYMVATAESTRLASNAQDGEELCSGVNFYYIIENVGGKISSSCELTITDHQSGKWTNCRKVNWAYS